MRRLLWSMPMLCLLLAACAKPLPPDKMAYAGKWQSLNLSLLITSSGSVAYKHVDGHMSKSVDGPLQAFEGDNFVVGVGPIKTTFVVSIPPHEVQSQWRMVVDGVELVRAP